MKGRPHVIKTKQDLQNLVSMALAATSGITKEEVITAIDGIIAAGYIKCPVVEASGHEAKIRYCSEAAEGKTTGNAGTIQKIETVEDEEGKPEFTLLTLSRNVTEEYIQIPAEVTEADRIGVTEEELNSFKEVLK